MFAHTGPAVDVDEWLRHDAVLQKGNSMKVKLGREADITCLSTPS